MKMNIAAGVLALFMFVGAAGSIAAQSEQKTTHKKTRTLSGCLQNQGGDEKGYQLTTAGNATWEIQSDSVKLAPHVGHTVTITGVVSNATLHGLKEDTKDEAKEHGVGKGSTEHGHMTVTNLKMNSDSCKN